MTQFLPYAILAGVVIVFFVICYVMYSGHSGGSSGKKKKRKITPEMQRKQNEEHAAWATMESLQSHEDLSKGNTTPVPKISNVKVKERSENPQETEFVTTKGEVVRADGRMYYAGKSKQKAQGSADDLDTTQVISREEVLAAMQAVDEEKAHHKTDEQAPLAGMTSVIAADLQEKQAAAEKVQEAKPVSPERKLSDETLIMDPRDIKDKLAVATAATAVGAAATQESLDQTQRLEPVTVDTADTPVQKEENPLRTDISEGRKPRQSPWGNDLPEGSTGSQHQSQSIWAEDSCKDSPVVQKCVAHFLNQYGIVTPDAGRQVQFITAAAFQRIGCHTEEEREQIIEPFIIQEALQDVQKAYSAHPDDYVASVALQSFYDIVRCPYTSTRHLVAVNSLKVMPFLAQEHYRILAVLLLFLYSRNSHNVDGETFRQYIDKYVMPFLERFPTERAYYQQLDYLHCTVLESKETHFAEILADSYPFLFRYRGFTAEELEKSLRGTKIPQELVVPSFNSNMLKLALVDEGMAARFFRMANITDRNIQNHLLRLAKKRPTGFSGEEALDILEEISPVFADLGDLWDSTLLRVSTLSLLGLYLAQGYVKEIIGEEFDLSRWFE
jgi:hypothetical protein